MTAPDPSKKLHALLKKVRAGVEATPVDPAIESCPEAADRLLWQLVFSFLTWEASTARALQAIKRLHASVVDYNEMRVCLSDELAAIIGDRYPRAVERAARLRSALNDLYKREHAVTLAPVSAMGKREARVYLESLEGAPSFVTARLVLLSLGGHAFPLDDRTFASLAEEGAIPADLDLAGASAWLERQFRAGEATEPYLLLEHWMTDRPLPRTPTRKAPPAPAPEPVHRPAEPRPVRKAAATAERKRTTGRKAAKD